MTGDGRPLETFKNSQICTVRFSGDWIVLGGDCENGCTKVDGTLGSSVGGGAYGVGVGTLGRWGYWEWRRFVVLLLLVAVLSPVNR